MSNRDDGDGEPRVHHTIPPSPQEYLARGLQLRQAGQPKKALTCFEAGLAADPDHEELRCQMGITWRQLGKPRLAMGCFRKVLSGNPNHLDAAIQSAELFQEGGFLEQAITLFGRLADRTPDDPDAHARMGDALRDAGLLEPAMDAFERALALEPDHLRALWGRAALLVGQGDFNEAEAAYERLLTLAPDHIDARIERSNLYRRFVPQWHFGMLNDEERNQAFDEAIRRAVTPDTLVLDVGCGTGLLSMMAIRAGASRVIACEVIGSIARIAEQIVARHGFSDRIRVVNAHSTTLRVGEHLERRADLLVAEVVDAALLGEGMLSVVRHARAHLLQPEARVIPQAATIRAMLVESEALWHDNHVEKAAGFDLSPFNRFANPAPFQKRLSHHPHRILSRPFDVFSFDFNGWPATCGECRLTPTIVAAGTCHAVVFWFELAVDDHARIDTGPQNDRSCWMQAVQLVEPLVVTENRTVGVRARHTECNLRFEVEGEPKS